MRGRMRTRIIVAGVGMFLCILTGCSLFGMEPLGAASSMEVMPLQTEETVTVDIDAVPAYSNQPYVELCNNEPRFSDAEKQRTDAFESYSELDALGRCGQAYANICQSLMPQEERQAIGQIRPSGWHTVKYPEYIEGNYLYHRCHLIGYQLAGENANEKNLITGTRYLNIEGMLPFENQVAAYVEQTGNHVLYRVTPIFQARDLVASGVTIEAWSVEDDGKGVCFYVYCYNCQPGIEITYSSGDSAVATDTEEAADTETIGAGQTDGETYILNTRSGKYHLPACESVPTIAQHNKEAFRGSRKELEDRGYLPCQRCLSEQGGER